MNKFNQFCALYNIANPLPASQHLLCLFVSYLHNCGLSHGTVKTYLSAVRHMHIANNIEEPKMAQMPKLKLVERGIKRRSAVECSKRERLPITPAILRQLKSLWAPRATEYEQIMMWAVCCTAFFGFFRLGELLEATPQSRVGIKAKDVTVDNVIEPTVISLHLRQSKTDQFGKGADIHLGRTKQDVCPVTALLAYLALRGNAEGPLFQCKDGTALSKQEFVSKLRVALAELGINEKAYAGHSFRIGAATTAADVGLEDSTIKLLGRWESNAFQTYIRTPRTQLAALTARLLGAPK